ncbi:MAG: phage distal tail protein, partial [Hominilimicola sp.]
ITVKHTGDIVIDCEKEIVYSGNTSLMTDISGDFFELVPGLDNTITVTGGGVVQINYTPKFLYDVDFDNMKWSE